MQGDELFSNYGDLPNEVLLFAYGFALENNPHDSVNVRLVSGVSTGAAPVKCAQQLSQATATTVETCTFSVERGGLAGVPKVRLM